MQLTKVDGLLRIRIIDTVYSISRGLYRIATAVVTELETVSQKKLMLVTVPDADLLSEFSSTFITMDPKLV